MVVDHRTTGRKQAQQRQEHPGRLIHARSTQQPPRRFPVSKGRSSPLYDSSDGMHGLRRELAIFPVFPIVCAAAVAKPGDDALPLPTSKRSSIHGSPSSFSDASTSVKVAGYRQNSDQPTAMVARP
nr:hypothetical protein Itr_chr02CG14390 [Ipomoea trifida]